MYQCGRFGSTSLWSQISAATVRLQLPETGSFVPTTVDSGQEFMLHVSGTGFELAGASQTRIKLAHSCDEYEGSDTLGAIPGGGGRPCESLSLSGGLQTCHVKFKLVIPGTIVRASICRRFGGGLYSKASNTQLDIKGFQVLSISPTRAASNAPFVVTIHGINFDPTLVDPAFTGILKAKICADYVCKGTSAYVNEGRDSQTSAL